MNIKSDYLTNLAMQNTKYILRLALCLVAFFFIFPVAESSAAVSSCNHSKTYNDPSTIYVSPSGGVNDQAVINNAFNQLESSGGRYKSVFLKSGTYTISDTVKMVSNSILEGDKDAILKLKDRAGWKVNIPLIGAKGASVSNIDIKCFEIDGNYANNFSTAAYDCYRGTSWSSDFTAAEKCAGDYRPTGRGYYNLVRLNGGTNHSMHDMYMHDSLGDGFSINSASNSKFYDNLVYKMGHEGAYISRSNTAEIYGNRVTCRTNTAARADNTNNVSIHDNVISAWDHWSAGGPGIELVKDTRATTSMNNIKVFNNYIYQTYGPGIQLVGSGSYDKSQVQADIHHNIFFETGLNYSIDWTAGIITSGFNATIEHNTFDHVYNGSVIVKNTASTTGSGFNVYVRNNIIARTQTRKNNTSGGAGITNLLSSSHTIYSQNNCFYQNHAGDVSGGSIIRSGDLNADPLFADISNNDYHLKSRAGRWNGSAWVTDDVNSPCIDLGRPDSDYSREPENNGDRANAGRYGNTSQASLTGNSPQDPMPPAPEPDIFPGFSPDTPSGGDDGGEVLPAYWYPTQSILDPNPYIYVNPALPDSEKDIDPLFPHLSDTPGHTTATCSQIPGSAGFVPCGKNMNDPNTPWDECSECNMCSMILMGQLTVEFLIEVAAVAATLALILAGFLYIFAAGRSELVSKAKDMIKYSLIGFIIIFIAWAIIDSILMTLGYIDPIGGSWHAIC